MKSSIAVIEICYFVSDTSGQWTPLCNTLFLLPPSLFLPRPWLPLLLIMQPQIQTFKRL